MRLACALLVASAGALTGCSDKANASNASNGSIVQGGAASHGSAQAEARNAYIRAYNTLAHNDAGAAAIYKRYLRMDVLGESPMADGLEGDLDTVDETLTELEAARETGSGDAGLDAAANAVLAKGAALVQLWTPLNAYFASEGYAKDRFARAREADAQVAAAFSGLLRAVDRMGTAFSRVAHARARAPRGPHKVGSDAMPARAAEAMAAAKTFVKQLQVLGASGNRHDADAVDAADALAFELDYALAALNSALAEAKARAKTVAGARPRQRRLAARARMAAGLAGMLEQWHRYKAQRSTMAMSRIVSNYNSAFGAYQRTVRRG